MKDLPYKDLETKAYAFMIRKHKGQEYNGHPYMIHPCHVHNIIESVIPGDLNLRIAAYLHDTLEDTKTSYKELAREFNDDIADLVKEVTKTGKGDTFGNLKTKRGYMLKLADWLSNLSYATSDKHLNKYMNLERLSL